MGKGFSICPIISVFQVLELLISSFLKISLKHLSCCTENIKVTRENVRKLGFERVFGKALKNKYLMLKGFGCRDFTGGFLTSQSLRNVSICLLK